MGHNSDMLLSQNDVVVKLTGICNSLIIITTISQLHGTKLFFILYSIISIVQSGVLAELSGTISSCVPFLKSTVTHTSDNTIKHSFAG